MSAGRRARAPPEGADEGFERGREEVSEATGASAPAAAGEGGSVGGIGDGGGYLTHRQVMIVLPGLILTMVLAMLDQLVVSTALPRIVGDLGGVSHLSWVVTAYILTSTITTPFYGKLGDMYGRKKLFIFAIVLFLIGSALSGLSTSMAMLISFRALQGLGAGGLMVGAMATLGEIVPPRERGKYMSYFMAAMMLATVGGPLLGGWITDAFSWRWIFYINLPVGGAALVYMWATLKLPVRRVERRIDYLGGVLLGVIATAVILVATWGGTEYSWTSAPVLGLIAVAVVAFVWFLVGRAPGGRADAAAARVQEQELQPRDGAGVLRRPGAVRRADVPPAVSADRPGRHPDGQRAAADADDGQLGRPSRCWRASW